MESHHDGDETKGSIHSSVRDYIEALEASRSVRTAGPKDLTVTIANFRNEGLKNQESLGEVEGSENWKRIALPKWPLLRNSTFGRVLAAFRGVRSFCLLPKPI